MMQIRCIGNKPLISVIILFLTILRMFQLFGLAMHYRAFMLSTLILSLTFTQHVMSKNNEVTMSVGDWPPYLSAELKHNGIIGHLLTDVFAAAGYELTLSFYPWPRAYQLAKLGKLDMTGVWMHKSEREDDFYYSDPVLDEQFVFFHLKTTDFDWQTMADLRGLSIGGGSEYSYGAAFDHALETKQISIERVPTKKQNWQKLLLGRISIYPEEVNVGYSSLKQYYSKETASLITHHPKPLLINLSYLLFPKGEDKSQTLMKDFNAQLKLFRTSGRYDKYFEAFHNGFYDKK